MLVKSLAAAGIQHRILTVSGEHAFMRDEGPRYDAAAADQVWAEAVGMFKRVFA
jgi:carboxymethylenebutenolidase